VLGENDRARNGYPERWQSTLMIFGLNTMRPHYTNLGDIERAFDVLERVLPHAVTSLKRMDRARL